MQKPGVTERFLSTMGSSANLGIAVMCAIAAFKGIMRPIFTLNDKKSDPETKKYTAMREFLTEVAALPMYAVLPLSIGWAAKKIFKGHAKVENITANTKFAVLGAATFMVPVVCNKIQPPIMAAYQRSCEAKKARLAQMNNSQGQPVAFKANYGMKVGG